MLFCIGIWLLWFSILACVFTSCFLCHRCITRRQTRYVIVAQSAPPAYGSVETVVPIITSQNESQHIVGVSILTFAMLLEIN